jgi:hypothetical protein
MTDYPVTEYEQRKRSMRLRLERKHQRERFSKPRKRAKNWVMEHIYPSVRRDNGEDQPRGS